jgi:hypothetical protein
MDAMEVRGFLERELAETLNLTGLLSVGAYASSEGGGGMRPDEYVSIAVQEAEARAARHWVVKMEIFVVAPMDDHDAAKRCKARALVIEEWMRDPNCPLRGGENEEGTLQVHGFHITNTGREKRERSAAEVIYVTVGVSTTG